MSMATPLLLTVCLLGSVGLGCAAVLPSAAEQASALAATVAVEAETAATTAMPAGAGRSIVADRADDGMFYVTLPVNGTPVRFLVDTGATHVVLSRGDARRAGVEGSDAAPLRMRTMGGTRGVRMARIDRVDVPGGAMRDVEALVLGERSGAGVSLLGQSLLMRLTSLRIDHGTLVIS